MNGTQTNERSSQYRQFLFELLENVIAAQFEAETVGTPA